MTARGPRSLALDSGHRGRVARAARGASASERARRRPGGSAGRCASITLQARGSQFTVPSRKQLANGAI